MNALFILQSPPRRVLALAALALSLAAPALAQTTNRPARLDYTNFQVIADRNIFNQRRYARSSSARRDTQRTVRSDYCALVGIMTYEKGPFVFFDGSSSDTRKVLKVGDSIIGYKLTAVTPSSVTLNSATNEVQLKIGMQFRREESGAWQVAAAPELGSLSRAPAVAFTAPPPAAAPRPEAAPPANGNAAPMAAADANGQPVMADFPPDAQGTNAAPDAAGGSDDPVLRRLMQRREQEMNR